MPVIGIYVSKKDEQEITQFRERLSASGLSLSRWLIHQIRRYGKEPVTIPLQHQHPAECRNCGGDGWSTEGGPCPACQGSGRDPGAKS